MLTSPPLYILNVEIQEKKICKKILNKANSLKCYPRMNVLFYRKKNKSHNLNNISPKPNSTLGISQRYKAVKYAVHVYTLL